MVNGLAEWDGLLELLKESDNEDHSGNRLVNVFVLDGFLKEFDSLIKNQSGLVYFIDAL